MNEHTPRRMKGSLLERAAELHGFGLPPVAQPAPDAPRAPAPQIAPAPAPQPAPLPVSPPPAATAPAPAPVSLGAPDPATDAASMPAAAPVATPAPVAPPLPISPTGRRRVAIDRAALAGQGLIAPGGPVTPLAEEFRLVKRQLLLTARAVAAADHGRGADRARMVLVASARPDEGKTWCAINLALSMAAEKDVEILLVDADFAKPDVLRRLGVPDGPGLLDALAGGVANVEDCILETDVPQLAVLPAGAKSHSDTELLASDRARAILDGLAAANPRRIVIFDSPPVLAASPASVLALQVGQTMLVVRADRTTESDLREAVAMLDACEHVQLVLNGVSFQPGGRRFGNYYGEAGK